MLKGIPDDFCFKEIHRSKVKINEACNPGRKHHCETKVVYMVNDESSYYCLQQGEGIYHDVNVTFIHKFKKFQFLSNVSAFQLHATISTQTQDSTPYFSVFFVGNNHGSWVDFAVEIKPKIEHSRKLSNFDKRYYHQAFVPTSSHFQTQHILSNVLKSWKYLLWIYTNMNDQKKNIDLNLTLQSKVADIVIPFSDTINHYKWTGRIELSMMKPTHCVSILGIIYNGSLTTSYSGS